MFEEYVYCKVLWCFLLFFCVLWVFVWLDCVNIGFVKL